MDIFQCKDGRTVELEWDGAEMTVWTTCPARQQIGKIIFDEIEGPSGRGDGDCFLVVNMHLEGPNYSRDYVGQGIGREIIRRVGEDVPVVFTPYDGNSRGDGSHLTDMGPGFAQQMVREGLASWGY